jgi:hypothetical protein
MITKSDQSLEPIDRRRLFLGIGWGLLSVLLCLFVPAGTLAWVRGWLFFVVLLGTMVPVFLWLGTRCETPTFEEILSGYLTTRACWRPRP